MFCTIVPLSVTSVECEVNCAMEDFMTFRGSFRLFFILSLIDFVTSCKKKSMAPFDWTMFHFCDLMDVEPVLVIAGVLMRSLEDGLGDILV